MQSFPDHFSATAASYSEFRPRYPAALAEWLATISPRRDRAWDCATGSGQAAVGLAGHFALVVATDPSTAQLAHAERHGRVCYSAMTAERPALADGSMDLVTVAQALHWIDRPAFYGEVRRVLGPGGVLAVWSYRLGTFGDRDLDGLLEHFYHETVGPYWPPERAVVDAGYGALEFPFDEMDAPPFVMEASWRLDQLAGYLSTWSAVRRARTATGADPVTGLVTRLAPVWGPAEVERTIRWPLEMRVGGGVG